MALTFEQAQAKTNQLGNALQLRRPTIANELGYYRGEQGTLRFASEKFSEQFARQFKGFSDNWCAPVASASPERMNCLGVRPYGTRQADVATNRAWERAAAARDMQVALEVRSAARRSFALVAPGPNDDSPRITFESPEMAIVDADPATRERRAGLLMWADDKMEYATLYTPDEVWKWQRPVAEDRHERNGRLPETNGGWQKREAEGDGWYAENPLGSVPLVEYRNRDLLDDQPISEIAGVMAMQDAMNTIWAYLLNALDAVSLPQRIITGAEPPSIPILDKDGQVIGKKPVELDDLMGERILWVPSATAKSSEWSAAQLDPFSRVINQIIEHIAAQTRTPPHYLMTKMVNTAAEALTISEAGLVSKTKQSIAYVNPDVRETYRLMALAQRRPQTEVDAIGAGVVIWSDVQYRSEAQRADALVKKRQMGYPMRWLLQEDGRTPEEIELIMGMIAEEQKADPLAAQRYLEDQLAPGEIQA